MRRYRRKVTPSGGQSGIRREFLRVVTMSLALLVFAESGREVTAQGNTSSEYQVKAAFLFHFAQFVDWPPEAFKANDSPITYCTAGGDPFEGGLDESLKGKTIGG